MRSEIDAIVTSQATKADKVRSLVAAGVPKPKVARLLDITVNHVYTVIARDRAKGSGAPPHRAGAPVGDLLQMVIIDERGRLVLPPEALELMALEGESQLVLLGAPGEIRLMTRDKAAEGLHEALKTAAPREAALARMLLKDIGK